MAASLSPSISPVFVAYVTVFALAAVACFASVRAASRIDDPDTRRGLTALLLTSGGWASSHVGFLLAPTTGLAEGFYVAGLVVGIAAVGPWLYFCSAYTGRSIHRDRTVQRVAIGLFVAIVAVKLTNPIHHLYFETTVATAPFPHLAVEHGIVHWISMGLAYALSTVGYFMLLERFTQVSHDTRPLFVLISVTGLPVALDVLGFATPYLINITYEPLGVAVFAVGVLTIYVFQFQAVQVTGGDDPTILLDDERRIREFNDGAAVLFPELTADSLGERLEHVVPALAAAVSAENPVFALVEDEDVRYYRLSESPFASDRSQLGRLLVVSDVTERERYRRELERQNERLEEFANMVSHDLRNPLNVAMARVDILADTYDDEHVETTADALDRMAVLIDDVLALARQGQPIDDTELVDLATLAEDAWTMVESPGATLRIDGNTTLQADGDRLKQLLENLFRNTIDHGQSEDATTPIQIRVGDLEDGFYVEDDGVGIPPADREQIFESGFTTDVQGTGFGLAIVAEIVTAHGWTITVVEGRDGGARFEITGVEQE